MPPFCHWICKSVVVVNVILAFPPDHVGLLATMLPVAKSDPAPPTVPVPMPVAVPDPSFCALSFVVTLTS